MREGQERVPFTGTVDAVSPNLRLVVFDELESRGESLVRIELARIQQIGIGCLPQR